MLTGAFNFPYHKSNLPGRKRSGILSPQRTAPLMQRPAINSSLYTSPSTLIYRLIDILYIDCVQSSYEDSTSDLEAGHHSSLYTCPSTLIDRQIDIQIYRQMYVWINRLRIVFVLWKEIQDNTKTIRLHIKCPLHV